MVNRSTISGRYISSAAAARHHNTSVHEGGGNAHSGTLNAAHELVGSWRTLQLGVTPRAPGQKKVKTARIHGLGDLLFSYHPAPLVRCFIQIVGG